MTSIAAVISNFQTKAKANAEKLPQTSLEADSAAAFSQVILYRITRYYLYLPKLKEVVGVAVERTV